MTIQQNLAMLKSFIAKFIPKPLRRFARRRLKKIQYFGLRYYCPVCRSWLRSFKPYGMTPRSNGYCPVCDSYNRHRLAWLFFNRKTNLFDCLPKKMLHIAPEIEFQAILSKVPSLDYLSADLKSPKAAIKMDVTDIKYSENSFDVIYCCDVLEHIPDDRKAIYEFNRVLKQDGWAIILVPITNEKTFEDLTVTDPAERARLFGWHSHLRKYGPDFKERLEEVGFNVTQFYGIDFMNKKETIRFGVSQRPIFYCTKKHTNEARIMYTLK